jgi:hypothetical protein
MIAVATGVRVHSTNPIAGRACGTSFGRRRRKKPDMDAAVTFVLGPRFADCSGVTHCTAGWMSSY